MGGMTFTPALYGINGRAAEIARAAHSADIGAEHLFLAILHDGRSMPAQALGRLASLDQVEAAVAERMSRPDYSPSVAERRNGLPVIRWAGTRAAVTRGDSYIGVEHVFLEIIADRDTIPARVLADLGCLDQAEAAVTEAMNAPLVVPADAVLLPDGQLDGPLRLAIHECVPEGATFGFNRDTDGRPWVRIVGGDTRGVLNAALTRLGRDPLPADGTLPAGGALSADGAEG
jgi:Clp amino terminal domain, pathogenicity island component